MDEHLSMSQVDRLLGLPRGTANRARSRYYFKATPIGRGWYIRRSELEEVRAKIMPPGPEVGLDDEFITVRQAAEKLGLAVTTIYNQITNGRITSLRTSTGRVLVHVPSLEHYRLTRLPAQVSLMVENQRRRKSHA